jgi:hypothetical protein
MSRMVRRALLDLGTGCTKVATLRLSSDKDYSIRFEDRGKSRDSAQQKAPPRPAGLFALMQ